MPTQHTNEGGRKALEDKTTRIRRTTQERLRFIHAFTGESHIEILDRLVEKEYRKLKKEYEKRDQGKPAPEKL